jgi:hypothetical protein
VQNKERMQIGVDSFVAAPVHGVSAVDPARYLSEVLQRLGLDPGGTTGPENKWLLNKALRLPVTLPSIPRQPGIRANCRALLGHWSADVPPEQGIAPTETRTIAAISGRVENCKFSLLNHKQQIDLNRSSSTSEIKRSLGALSPDFGYIRSLQ